MNQRRDLLQESLAAIERLEARLAASEGARHEPIAIIGVTFAAGRRGRKVRRLVRVSTTKGKFT